MNKRANRRAFFVCAAICLIYVSMLARLPERFGAGRVSEVPEATSEHMSLSVPAETPGHPEVQRVSSTGEAEQNPSTNVQAQIVETTQRDTDRPVQIEQNETLFEPTLFIALPIVIFAIRQGIIDREGLIFTRQDGYNKVSWKKPLEILKDKDEEGLKNISRTIGKKSVLDFLKKEGITITKDLDVERIMLGRGYKVERAKLIALYDSQVPEDYRTFFPFRLQGMSMFRGKEGFELRKIKDELPVQHPVKETEWVMPNLLDLPVKAALEKLTIHTAKIKIFGSGAVADQLPKPSEKVQGEMECTIYGRTYKP
jgi:hypothetical protein